MWEQLHSTIMIATFFSEHLKCCFGLSVHWLVYLKDHFYPEVGMPLKYGKMTSQMKTISFRPDMFQGPADEDNTYLQ